MPQKVIYRSPSDTTAFDFDRYKKSLLRYGEIDENVLKRGLEALENYNPVHVSCLLELGINCIKDEKEARRYYDDHHIEVAGFERLRRITGYLVGSLERWNDGKKAEEKARVKHNVAGFANSIGQYTEEEKVLIEKAKLENSVMSQF